jgi:hypothetical protein
MHRFTASHFAVAAALLAGAMVPSRVAAQGVAPGSDNTAYGTTAAEFLLLGANARGAALGGAFAAIANDPSALYYNPAGIAMMNRPGMQLSTYTYVANTRYNWGGFALPFSGGSRAFGVQLGNFGFNDQPVYTVAQPDGTGAVYSVSQTFGGLTFAQNFSDRFAAGLTAKFVNDRLGGASGSAFAVDFGTNFHAALGGHPVKFSFTLANLGSSLSYKGQPLNVDIPRQPLPGQPDVPSVPQPGQLQTKGFQLPTVFRVGLSYDLFSGDNNHLSLLGDFNQATSNKAGFVFGSEWAVNRLGGSPFGVALRGSYSYQPANNIKVSDVSLTALSDEQKLQGLALGGGLNYSTGNFNLGVDYAYRYMGVLGATHFFTLGLGW